MDAKSNLAKLALLTLTIAVGSAIGVTVALYAYDKLTNKPIAPTVPNGEKAS